MTLYEITEDYLNLVELASDPKIDEQTIKDTMEAIDGEFEIKAENYAKAIRQTKAEAEALDAEIKRLSARKSAMENSVKKIQKALEEAMIATGKTKFKTELFSFYMQKNKASLKLSDELNFDDVPIEFIKFPEPEIDKEAVKESINNGAEYSWAHLEQSESLRIR